MRDEDGLALHELSGRAFGDLSRRLHESPQPQGPPERTLVRIRHLLARDAGGAWAAEHDGRLVGAANAIERDGLWGLSLLVVDPEHQSAGLGRELLARALEYGGGGRRGGVILASPDPRALRVYARAGFTPHPCLSGRGRPAPLEAPAGVREGGPDDFEWMEQVDVAIRGAGHGSDIDALLRADCRLFVVEERGYALLGGGRVRLLAALDEAAATDLLRAVLAHVPAGEEVSVEWITALQGWAMGPVLDARLPLAVDGAVFVRGDIGRFSPYLPNGAYY
jgi:GNAT superfamily N-acetyltransferase